MGSDTIYLDNNATTRPHPLVVEAINEVLGDGFGNPSSIHGVGEAARRGCFLEFSDHGLPFWEVDIRR